jgi:hypothetical protein
MTMLNDISNDYHDAIMRKILYRIDLSISLDLRIVRLLAECKINISNPDIMHFLISHSPPYSQKLTQI